MTNLLAKTTEPGVLQFGLSMLNFIGLHGASRAKMCRYLFGVSWISANVILPKAILGSGKEEFDSVARSVAEMIFFCDACIAIAIFVNRRTSFEQMRLLLEAIFERYKSAECLEEIRRYKRWMDYFAKGYVAYIVFLLVPFLIAPILWTLCLAVFFAEDNRNDYILVVEVQFYYLDIRRNIFHYLIYFCCCFPAVLCSAYQSSIKATVFLTSLQYGTKLFDLIHLRIKSLNSLEVGEERREELRQIIELHKMTLKYTQLLEETITLILINQMLNCVAIWCLMMVYLSTNYGPNAVNVAVLFIVLMGEMVFYCVNGTRLSENAQNVSNAIYNYQWYYESVGMQRDFRFMIQRAQQPTGVTAAKFYFVNIERLGIVMQASYSYYLLLKSQF